MITKAEAVVVGGGIVGASICYHLAKEGMDDIALVDKSMMASGDSSNSAGSFRHQWSTELRIRIAKEGIAFWKEFAKEEELGFYQHGYMFLLSTEKEAENFERLVSRQNRLGVDSKMVTPQEASEIVGGLNVDGISAAAFCPSDGYVDESEYALSCIRRARELGAKTYVRTEVQGIRIESGKVESVRTNAGEIHTPIVVVATGAWSEKVMLMAGIDVPLTPIRCQILICRPSKTDMIPKTWVRDYHNDFYYRWDVGDLFWVGGGTEKSGCDPDAYKRNADQEYVVDASKQLDYRFPEVGEAAYVRGYAGCIQVTPDLHQIVGRVPQVEGLFTAFGGSGTFACWGVLGRALAELIVHGKPKTLDISSLGVERFASGNLLPVERIMSPEEGKIEE